MPHRAMQEVNHRGLPLGVLKKLMCHPAEQAGLPRIGGGWVEHAGLRDKPDGDHPARHHRGAGGPVVSTTTAHGSRLRPGRFDSGGLERLFLSRASTRRRRTSRTPTSSPMHSAGWLLGTQWRAGDGNLLGERAVRDHKERALVGGGLLCPWGPSTAVLVHRRWSSCTLEVKHAARAMAVTIQCRQGEQRSRLLLQLSALHLVVAPPDLCLPRHRGETTMEGAMNLCLRKLAMVIVGGDFNADLCATTEDATVGSATGARRSREGRRPQACPMRAAGYERCHHTRHGGKHATRISVRVETTPTRRWATSTTAIRWRAAPTSEPRPTRPNELSTSTTTSVATTRDAEASAENRKATSSIPYHDTPAS